MRVLPDDIEGASAGDEGLVIRQEPCAACNGQCGYDDLIVSLDGGRECRIYEPEVEDLEYPYDWG